MAEITREQVERLLAAARAEGSMQLDEALPEWYERCPVYVREAWRLPGLDAFLAALTRWRDSLPVGKVARWDAEEGHYVLTPPITDDYRATTDPYAAIAWGYTIEGGPEVDDAAADPGSAEDSPERLKARREALGWSQAEAANAIGAAACGKGVIAWVELQPATQTNAYNLDLRTRYAAALSAAEERATSFVQASLDHYAAQRAATAIDTSGPVTVVAGDGMRLAVNGVVLHDRSSYVAQPGDLVSAVWALDQPEPAPEVVDVPQPEPWHARLVRLAQDVTAASKAHEDAQAEREAAERREADAWAALRNARGALHGATEVSAILAAQQPATGAAPTRPEPRFKVGDWVRALSTGTVYQIGEIAEEYCRKTPGCASVSYKPCALTPSLDPALHETARRTIAWLREQRCAIDDVFHAGEYRHLPGYAEWVRSADGDQWNRWAAQLERLLGDA